MKTAKKGAKSPSLKAACRMCYTAAPVAKGKIARHRLRYFDSEKGRTVPGEMCGGGGVTVSVLCPQCRSYVTLSGDKLVKHKKFGGSTSGSTPCKGSGTSARPMLSNDLTNMAESLRGNIDRLEKTIARYTNWLAEMRESVANIESILRSNVSPRKKRKAGAK